MEEVGGGCVGRRSRRKEKRKNEGEDTGVEIRRKRIGK